jgi:hypothetical protein
VGVGVALAPFVFAGVSILRGMIGAARRRRIVLPIAGVALGWLFAALLLLLLESSLTPRNAAIVVLTGFWAFVVSAGLHSQSKEARRG